MHTTQTRKKIFLSFFIIFLLVVSSMIPISAMMNQNTVQNDNETVDTVEYRGVIIGISEGSLIYSIQQLRGFEQTLINGGWNESNIHILVNAIATRDMIEQEINWLSENTDENDVSLIYYIGHGGSNTENEYITTYDIPMYDYELDVLLESLNGTVVVFIDACYSGGFIPELEGSNRLIMTACADDEPTYQVADLESGMFGFFLNISFSWFTKNIESAYSYSRLFIFLYGRQLSRTYGEDYMTHPQFSDGNEGRTKLILKHSYVKNFLSLLSKIRFDGSTNLWIM